MYANKEYAYGFAAGYKLGCDKTKWIRVEDRLPQCAEPVLTVRGGVVIPMGDWIRPDGLWFFDSCYDEPVTCWRPFPEPPKGEDEQ